MTLPPLIRWHSPKNFPRNGVQTTIARDIWRGLYDAFQSESSVQISKHIRQVEMDGKSFILYRDKRQFLMAPESEATFLELQNLQQQRPPLNAKNLAQLAWQHPNNVDLTQDMVTAYTALVPHGWGMRRVMVGEESWLVGRYRPGKDNFWLDQSDIERFKKKDPTWRPRLPATGWIREGDMPPKEAVQFFWTRVHAQLQDIAAADPTQPLHPMGMYGKPFTIRHYFQGTACKYALRQEDEEAFQMAAEIYWSRHKRSPADWVATGGTSSKLIRLFGQIERGFESGTPVGDDPDIRVVSFAGHEFHLKRTITHHAVRYFMPLADHAVAAAMAETMPNVSRGHRSPPSLGR